jgi:prepilin-type N-terminal cleavage/methylation domain-containing protein
MRLKRLHGFTLVELVVAIVITGILLSIAMRSGSLISRTGKVEETKQKMEALAFAIAGNPSLTSDGIRSDFGYVGDVGSLPADLVALSLRPAGYASWKGPYMRSRFAQSADEYAKDAWGTPFVYSGVSITSNGSGSSITRSVAGTEGDLLINRITGSVTDASGAPPTQSYCDSVTLILSVPDGIGGVAARVETPDAGGHFSFDSIPVGNHDLEIIYRPTHDTLRRFVSVLPGSAIYNEYRLSSSVWGPSWGLALVPGSDTVSGSPPCSDVSFWITNNTGIDLTISSISLSWPSPAAYYNQIYWGSTCVFDQGGSPRGESGQTYNFLSSQTLAAGQKTKIRVTDFRQNNSHSGGNHVSISGTSLTVVFSDGSAFTEVFPTCP